MQKIIALRCLVLALTVPVLANASDACPPATLTDEDAIRWMGTPLEKLSAQGRAYAMASMKAAELGTARKRMAAIFDVTGGSGKDALETLERSGFSCRFEVSRGVQVDKTRPTFLPADWPLYRCSKTDDSSCDCRRFQVTFSLAPQDPGSPPEQHASALKAMVLDRKHVTYSCHDD